MINKNNPLFLLTKNQNMGIILTVLKENTLHVVLRSEGVLRIEKGWKRRFSSVCMDSDL